MEVAMNGVRLQALDKQLAKDYDRMHGMQEGEDMQVFEIPTAALKSGGNEIAVVSKAGVFVVKRAEVALQYGDVNQYGYFN